MLVLSASSRDYVGRHWHPVLSPPFSSVHCVLLLWPTEVLSVHLRSPMSYEFDCRGVMCFVKSS